LNKVLITGADGFIGKALCDVLLRNGHKVRGTVLSEDLIEHLPGGVEPLISGDIGDAMDLRPIFKDTDVVIHLAARVHVMCETIVDPMAEFMRVNAEGTRKLAIAAAAMDVKKFVFLSSIKVNGEATYGKPFSADDPPDTKDPYGISKMKAEEAIKNICYSSDMEFYIIRPTLVYGPAVKGNFLRLVNLVDKGVPLPLGGIKNARDILYLGNLVDALSRLTVSNIPGNETYLISDDEHISTPRLIETIANAMEKKARLINIPSGMLKMIGKIIGKSDEIDRLIGSLCVDSGKIQKVLGWRPPFSFEEGIKATVRWYREERM
jgi:nucleoside-diphosphate-sugar epimerase